MKKLLSIILLLSLSVAFYSCGGDMEEETKKPQEFVWNGDWNDPADPNFKPEGYNPIKGVWRRVNTTLGLQFTEDFQAYELTFYSFDGYDKRYMSNYIINDNAYKIGEGDNIRRYKIEGEVLTIYYFLDVDDKNRDRVYVRIEP